MDSSSLKGSELGKLVLSSGLLHSSWSKISEIHETTYPNKDSGLGIKIFKEAKLTFVVFAAPPICRNDSDSTPLSGSQIENPFHFLCSEKISSFSLHTPAFQHFASACNKNLPDLKSKLMKLLKSKKPVIITGAALGGSVASLFTLWLLESIDPKLNRPLCITFGSPLIGDASLQQILENSVRNSCFLHVADAAQTPITAGFFKPFGTFLICFDSDCICIEDPEAVMELLTGVNTDLVDWRDYGQILQRLDQSSMADSGLMIDDIISRMDERAADKKQRFDKLKKLNEMKIYMAYIEWYKKKSKDKKTGYYDEFKTQPVFPYENYRKELNNYWESMVEEVEKKPQTETSYLKTRCLFSGNNYRRLMEPLDIAEYYLRRSKEEMGLPLCYLSRRPHRYAMLEKWFKDKSIKAVRCERRDLSELLTFDSCFWAEVEEALIVISLLKTQEGMGDEALMGNLERFEEYVWGLIDKREVSPEIFLEKSSFMKWWKEYKEIKERDEFNSSPSRFTQFMNSGEYQSYGQ